MLPTDDGVSFPVAKTRTGLDDGRTFTYRPSRVPTDAFAVLVDPLSVCVMTSKMHIKNASLLFVSVDMKIDRLVRNCRPPFKPEPVGYLLRAPLELQQTFYLRPGPWLDLVLSLSPMPLAYRSHRPARIVYPLSAAIAPDLA